MRIPTLSILLLAILVSACSRPDADTLIEARAAEGKGDFQKAMTLYQSIIDDSPDGEYTAEASFRLAALHRSFKNDALKAASLYESVCVKFPESEFAHQGLFLAGFIYNNDLGNLDRAKQSYDKYLKLYPDSAWAKDALFELANLGKTPDEILQSLRDTLKEAPKAPAVSEDIE